MKRLVVMFAAALFMLFDIGYTYAEKPDDLKQTVIKCEYIAKSKSPFSTFSAYVRNDGQIMMFGTEKDIFEFTKCMSEQGVDLDKTLKP